MDEIQQLQTMYEKFGPLGLVAGLLLGVVRVYKMDAVQGLLPEKVRWTKITKRARTAIVFVFSFLGSGLMAYLQGAGLVAVAGTAMLAGFTAIGARKTMRDFTGKSEPSVVYIPVAGRESSIKTSITGNRHPNTITNDDLPVHPVTGKPIPLPKPPPNTRKN